MDNLALILFDSSQPSADTTRIHLIDSGIEFRILIAGTTEELAFHLAQSEPLAVLVSGVDRPSAWAGITDLAMRRDVPVLAWVPGFEPFALTEALQARDVTVQSVAQVGQLSAALNRFRANLDIRAAMDAALRMASENASLADHLLESDSRPIALLHQGLHVRANPSYCRLLGIEDSADLSCRSILDCFSARDGDLRSTLREMNSAGASAGSLRVVGSFTEGRTTEFDMRLVPMRHQGEPCTLVMLLPARPARAERRMSPPVDAPAPGYPCPASRLGFLEALQGRLTNPEGAPPGAVLVCLRPDGFDSACKLLGHAESESYLSDLESIMLRCLTGNDLVCRFSDHDFLLYMETQHAADPLEVVQSLRQTCSDHTLQFRDGAMTIRCSAGAVTFSAANGSLDDLIGKARHACGQAADQGDCLVRYRPNLEIASPEVANGEWVERLQEALESGHFYSLQKTVVDLEGDGEPLVDSQVFLREARGDTGPEVWQDAAAACRMGSRIDRAVLPGQLAALSVAGPQTGAIICISTESLSDPGFPAWLAGQLAGHSLPGASLLLQISSQDALSQTRSAHELVRELSPLGCRLALSRFEDDGAYRNLLVPLCVRLVRLPGHWIMAARRDPDRLQHMRQMVQRMRGTGIEVMADGVGSAADLSLAWQAGIRRLSGEFLIEQDNTGYRQVS